MLLLFSFLETFSVLDYNSNQQKSGKNEGKDRIARAIYREGNYARFVSEICLNNCHYMTYKDKRGDERNQTNVGRCKKKLMTKWKF